MDLYGPLCRKVDASPFRPFSPPGGSMEPFDARYSEPVKAEVRRRKGPPQRQRVAQISPEFGIHVATLYNWHLHWRLQGEVVPASAKDPEGWSAADKFTLVLETAGLTATELSAYCRERGLFPEQLDRWRKAAEDANAQPLQTMDDQKNLQKRH
jgi:transposase-like protein